MTFLPSTDRNLFAMPDDTDEFLSDAQLCDLLRVSSRTTARWRNDGGGPAYIRAGARRILYRRSDLDLWLARQTAPHRAAEAVRRAA